MPRLLPLLTPHNVEQACTDFPTDIANALKAIMSLKTDVADTHDALLVSKIAQAHSANAHRNNEPTFNVGDHVYLSTAHQRQEYLNGNNKCITKFMPRFDRPYTIVSANPESSTYTLDLPEHTNVYPTFHASKLKKHVPNNAELFPSRELQRPTPIMTASGSKEWEVEKILNTRQRGRGHQYLICWRGYGAEVDVWVPAQELEGTHVLQQYKSIKKPEDAQTEDKEENGTEDNATCTSFDEEDDEVQEPATHTPTANSSENERV
jgi:hypothetical protein